VALPNALRPTRRAYTPSGVHVPVIVPGPAAPAQPAARPRELAGAAAALSAAVLVMVGAMAATARQRSTRPGAATKAFENEPGVQAPLGYFDPLGISSDGDVGDFYRRREAELKNGRVAMFATIGYIVPEYWRFPGYCSPTLDLKFEDIPNGIGALGKVPLEGWLQIIAWCGFYELCVNQPCHPTEPGNYFKGRFGIFERRIIKDAELRKSKLNVELANGRLAMVAILGMMVQNGVVGNTGPGMWLPGASPAA